MTGFPTVRGAWGEEGGMGGGGWAPLRPSHDFLRKLSIKADAPHGAPLPLKNEAPPIEK